MKERHSLDGKVILRYAHAFSGGGGGVEQHLEVLDRALLQRHQLTVIRVHLASQQSQVTEEEISFGPGRLIKVALPVTGRYLPELLRDSGAPCWQYRLRGLIRDLLLCNPETWRILGKPYALRRPISRRPGEPANLESAVSQLLQRYQVNLVMLHFLGGADSEDVIRAARKFGIPLAVQNHFSNDRFRHLAMRKHALVADGVAGVNGLDVPRFLRGKFVNLSNGIDTDYFESKNVGSRPSADDASIILLPARIVRSKGHLDLVRAARLLAGQGINPTLRFAGRTDPGPFAEELNRAIDAAGIPGKVQFLGPLNQEQLRQAYADATVVALPTYHHEGLPRVVLEAQAMGVPPIAYATGGVPEGIIDGRTGFLLKTGDVRGLANRIHQLLSDRILRLRMGEVGRGFVEKHFSLSALAGRHEIFYRRILEPDHK